MAETVAELRAMSENELIKNHDAHARSVQVGTNHYLRELHRRDQMHLSKQMLRYTRSMTWMTVIITVATLMNVGIFLFNAFAAAKAS